MIFDYHEDDIYLCTADIGWVTGHSYIVYGPLAQRRHQRSCSKACPTIPTPGRFWDIVDKHKVNIFYTAPTAIRALMSEGESWVKKHDLTSLSSSARWASRSTPRPGCGTTSIVGQEKLPIVDTWWQTETGGILITPLPGACRSSPARRRGRSSGSCPVGRRRDGKSLEGATKAGTLCIDKPWPGMMRGIYGDHQALRGDLLQPFPGNYFTGDGAGATRTAITGSWAAWTT